MDSQSIAAPSWSIAPWLTLRRSAEAVEFYKRAFGAVEVYRFQISEESVVARLSIHGAEFWVGDESPQHRNFSPELLGGSSLRIIFTVPNPHEVFNQAIAAGAREVYPVNEAHGWLVGRVVDPYGHHWEIGRPLAEP